jgi:hypothetical protein
MPSQMRYLNLVAHIVAAQSIEKTLNNPQLLFLAAIRLNSMPNYKILGGCGKKFPGNFIETFRLVDCHLL